MWTTNEELGASLIAYTRKWNAPEGDVKAHSIQQNEWIYTRYKQQQQKNNNEPLRTRLRMRKGSKKWVFCGNILLESFFHFWSAFQERSTW